MPSYFFHLKFELYLHPRGSSETPLLPKPPNIYIPPPNTDIFCSSLPVHEISSWGTPLSPSKSRLRSKTVVSSADAARTYGTPLRPHHERRYSQINEGSPGPRPNSSTVASSREVSQYSATKDWRFGAVSVLSIDMNKITTTQRDGVPKGKSSEKAPNVGTGSGGGIATKAKFIPSDPKNTEIGWGVVHLYRDGQETPDLYDDSLLATGAESNNDGSNTNSFKEEDCTTLCILAVPSYMTPSDLLGYVGEQTREDVSHFRLIRTERANKYMVLMKFRKADRAKEWRKEWDGKLFNSMEPENCHVVFIKSIQFLSEDSNHDPTSFPRMSNDPFTPLARSTTATIAPATSSSPVDTKSISSSLSIKPVAPPTPALVELPTCPVCLERMDESTGLLTILCQHVFHCACLEKWRGSGCPVCRYTQNDPLIGLRHTGSDDNIENECSVCGSTSNLWICLICGNTGCGRYDSAHAFAHYEATSHSYAMDVATQRVWDYVGDGYVHRLIQNKSDGKLVDLPAAYSHNPSLPLSRASHPNEMTAYSADTVPREKLDNMGMEYTYLLTSQLESQRRYFEEQVERAVDKAAKAASVADEASKSMGMMSDKLDEIQTQYKQALSSISSLEASLEKYTARATTSSELARKMTRQFQEEKTMNEALLQRIHHLEARTKEAEEKAASLQIEKQELEEQNRDLTFFISGQQKLKELEEAGDLDKDEVEEGTVEVGSKGKGRRRKGRDKK